jgi:haloalkane dehalogenase
MIPVLVRGGCRVLAPDLLGFGRSDKPYPREAVTFELQVKLIRTFVEQLNLQGASLFCQDWGGLIGLRVVSEVPGRFAAIVAGNTGLPDAGPWRTFFLPRLVRAKVWWESRKGPPNRLSMGTGKNAFFRWLVYSQTVESMPIGKIIQLGTVGHLDEDVVAAYEAPFPEERFKEAARRMPYLVTTEWHRNRRAWKILEAWDKPFLTVFSDSDPITRGGDRIFQKRVPGAQGQPHRIIENAGHFLQEDKGEELAGILLELVQKIRRKDD